LVLRSPELDLKLAVGDYGRAQYRARLLAKFLQRAGRSSVPVGVGLDIEPKGGKERQGDWVKDYDLKSYPGRVHQDGVQAMINLIMESPEPITLIAVGPLPNVAEALRREPRIAGRARFVGMHGSVKTGYGRGSAPAAEWNVKAAPAACQQVFSAAWPMTITPLDTCGLVHVTGDLYQRFKKSTDPIAAAILENYQVWAQTDGNANLKTQPETRSSTLFDTVAVYLAFSQALCRMETVNLRVTDDGFTRIDPAGKAVLAAMSWKDQGAFESLLVDRLTSKPAQP
jgi:inosine-uridine nucleoside N-ribohydrolase